MMCRAIPYEGREQYIFLSYCHKDAPLVYPLLEQMVLDGYRIWYDDGNHPGDDWQVNIANHLDGCQVCLAMLSENSEASYNCRSEINLAIKRGKKLAAIMLEDFEMSLAMQLQLGLFHYLKKFEYPSDCMLLQKLYETEGMNVCRAEPGSLAMREIPVIEQKKPEDRIGLETGNSPRMKTNIVNLDAEDSSAASEPEVNKKREEPQKQPPKPECESKAEPKEKKKVIIKVKSKMKQEPHDYADTEVPENDQLKHEASEHTEIGSAPEETEAVAVISETETPDEQKKDCATAKKPNPGDDGNATIYSDPNEGKTIYRPAAEDDEDDDGHTVLADKTQTMVLLRTSCSKGYVLNTSLVEIGRSKKRDVVLSDNDWISGHHADIIQHKGCCYLRDQNSTNGTFYGNERLESDGQAQLQSPSVFRLYDETFIFFSGVDANRIAAEKAIYLLRNTQSQEIRLLDEGVLPLDRSHIWENGTFQGDREISRSAHAAVRRDQNGLFLEDKGNPNGVFLNKRRLAANESSQIQSGDQIRLGKTILEVCIVTL